MKKNVLAVLLAAGMVLALTACGESNVKEVTREGNPVSVAEEDGGNGAEPADATEGQEALSGYVFVSGETSIAMDMDMEKVLATLGEPKKYFEAASCAFEGLDKTYTYDHFQVTTYPMEDKDLVNGVLLLDDMIATPEGLSVGSSKDDMIAAYGEDYKEVDGLCVYTKDGSHLQILLSDDKVVTIEYASGVLD